jgi:2-polyprenyl-3-methyl-5-hydroxy-6-metoxy-1,4-benzoquinol methylase
MTSQTSSVEDIADWDRNAERYAALAGGTVAGDRIYAQFREMLWECVGNVGGRTVLDAGCGHGWLSRALLDRGAHVVGIDGSATLLSKARELCPEARLLQHDLASGLPPLSERFDLVVAYMVLMDIPTLESFFRDLKERCTVGTRLIVTLNHPAFFYADLECGADGVWYRKVKTYLKHEAWRLPTFGGHNHYHRPLSFYFEQLRAAGFLVRRFFEPVPVPAPDAIAPEFRREVPVFALLEAVYLPDVA